jgi:hypothetical protein
MSLQPVGRFLVVVAAPLVLAKEILAPDAPTVCFGDVCDYHFAAIAILAGGALAGLWVVGTLIQEHLQDRPARAGAPEHPVEVDRALEKLRKRRRVAEILDERYPTSPPVPPITPKKKDPPDPQ